MAAEAAIDPKLQTLLKELDAAEQKLFDKFGGDIFDYQFLFTKTQGSSLKINQLSAQSSVLIDNYINSAKALLDFYEIKLTKTEKTELFTECMHNIYLLRYVQARKDFADFQLTRIATKTETRLLELIPKSKKVPPFLPATVSFLIPDSFVINNSGIIDLQATALQENIDHQIKSTLSTVTIIDSIKEAIYKNLLDITIKGMVPRLYKTELLELNELLAQLCLNYFTSKVYTYLEKGVPVTDAVNNVRSYYAHITENSEPKFHPELSDLEDDITDLINSTLAELDQLYPETKEVIRADYFELILFMINNGDFLANNYYKIRFRQEGEFDKSESNYNLILDVYVLLDENKMLPLPMESYNIDYTAEAKTMIFDTVTSGFENPDFTLDDYLAPE